MPASDLFILLKIPLKDFIFVALVDIVQQLVGVLLRLTTCKRLTISLPKLSLLTLVR